MYRFGLPDLIPPSWKKYFTFNRTSTTQETTNIDHERSDDSQNEWQMPERIPTEESSQPECPLRFSHWDLELSRPDHWQRLLLHSDRPLFRSNLEKKVFTFLEENREELRLPRNWSDNDFQVSMVSKIVRGVLDLARCTIKQKIKQNIDEDLDKFAPVLFGGGCTIEDRHLLLAAVLRTEYRRDSQRAFWLNVDSRLEKIYRLSERSKRKLLKELVKEDRRNQSTPLQRPQERQKSVAPSAREQWIEQPRKRRHSVCREEPEEPFIQTRSRSRRRRWQSTTETETETRTAADEMDAPDIPTRDNEQHNERYSVRQCRRQPSPCAQWHREPQDRSDSPVASSSRPMSPGWPQNTSDDVLHSSTARRDNYKRRKRRRRAIC